MIKKKKILILLIFFIIFLLVLLYKKVLSEEYENMSESNRIKKYVIITSSLIDDVGDKRKEEYILGINSILKRCKNKNYTLIIVENNGKRNTFLDDFKIPVLYTNNNTLNTSNKGVKEINDVFDVIKHFNINDDDFVVKITGRYKLDDTCPFFDECDNIENTNYDAIIKYGGFEDLTIYTSKTNDCITGLIGLKCKYIKTINNSIDNKDSIELDWAKSTHVIPDNKICILSKLGITLNPLGYTIFNR